MKKEVVAGVPRLWIDSYAGKSRCPGCHHTIIDKLICEVIDEIGIEGEAIGVGGIGCGGFAVFSWDIDIASAPHGRPVDIATAIKRALYGRPIVFTIQGDGDCFAIGAGSLMGAAARAEKITVFMENNLNYGTTGGQLAPTTLMGQKTTTTPDGRNPNHGYPVHVPELLATVKGVSYTARGALNTPVNYQHTKGYIKTAFQKQIDNLGLSFVEILSACPANWHLTPVACLEHIEKVINSEYPLGEFKNVDKIE